MRAFLQELNPRQLEAVTAPLWDVLVLAGAGSGKTKVLISRLVHLIDSRQCLPEQLLALTYTNKAAGEMQSRVRQWLGSHLVSGLQVGTFHRFGLSVLRQHHALYGLPQRFSLVDNEDRLKILREIVKRLALPEVFTPRHAAFFIHQVKNLAKPPAELAQSRPHLLSPEVWMQLYAFYEAALRDAGAVDLDDLICVPTVLMRQFPELLQSYRERFRSILVDEYQDTNPAQYELLRLLMPPAKAFVVGDDAQAIYGFRGSDISNILNFEKDFPAAKVVVLEQNYRSSGRILQVAAAVLRHSPEQKEKLLWTESGQGTVVEVRGLSSEAEEARYVVESVLRLASSREMLDQSASVKAADGASLTEPMVYDTDENQDVPAASRPFSILDYMLARKQKHAGGDLDSRRRIPMLPSFQGDRSQLASFAVLYRTHAQSRALEEACLLSGVPYRIFGGLKFYERKEIKDILSYARLLANPFDAWALQRATGLPPRGLGPKSVLELSGLLLALQTRSAAVAQSEIFALALAKLGEVKLGPRQRQAALEFLGLMAEGSQQAESRSLKSWLEWLTGRLGLKQYLFAEYPGEEGQGRLENVLELISITGKYDDVSFWSGLDSLLEEVALFDQAEAAPAGGSGALTLMTLHAAKGLEFDTVFLVGLEEGVLPHSRSLDNPAELAEEVRLMYVGVTRARQRLFLSYCLRRGLYGTVRPSLPSRFLQSLPSQAVNWRGQRPRFFPGQPGDEHITYEPYDF